MNITRSGVDNVLDGRLLDVSHVAEDGEDEDAGQQARAGVDEARNNGISKKCNCIFGYDLLNKMLSRSSNL